MRKLEWFRKGNIFFQKIQYVAKVILSSRNQCPRNCTKEHPALGFGAWVFICTARGSRWAWCEAQRRDTWVMTAHRAPCCLSCLPISPQINYAATHTQHVLSFFSSVLLCSPDAFHSLFSPGPLPLHPSHSGFSLLSALVSSAWLRRAPPPPPVRVPPRALWSSTN